MVSERVGDELNRVSGKAKEWTGRATGNARLQRRGRIQSGLAKVKITGRNTAQKVVTTLRKRRSR